MVERPSRRFKICTEALLKVWEALPEVRERLGGPSGGSGIPAKVCKVYPKDREGQEGPLSGLKGVERPSRRSGKGREALPEVWEARPEVQDGSRGLPKGLGGPPKGP